MLDKKWDLIFTEKAEKKFKNLSTDVQRRIINFFDERVLVAEDPIKSNYRGFTRSLAFSCWRSSYHYQYLSS